jgi:hypothetical protein
LTHLHDALVRCRETGPACESECAQAILLPEQERRISRGKTARQGGNDTMPEMKECFGQCANMRIGFRDHSKQHYFRVDEEKLKECDTCHLFTKCMFLRYNEVIKDLLQIINEQAHKHRGASMMG